MLSPSSLRRGKGVATLIAPCATVLSLTYETKQSHLKHNENIVQFVKAENVNCLAVVLYKMNHG